MGIHLPIGLFGQTLAQRLESAGTIYVQKVPQMRLFVVVEQVQGIPDWDSAQEMKSSVGDTLLIDDGSTVQSTFGGVQGKLLHYRDADQELLNLINDKIIGIFKSAISANVKFEDNIEEKGDSYFILEIMINKFDTENDIVLTRPEGELAVHVSYSASLYEMSPEFKKPKKVTSISKTGKSERVDLFTNAEMVDLDEAMKKLSGVLYEMVGREIDELGEKSKKKLTKAMSK